jgi:hypothetical protein
VALNLEPVTDHELRTKECSRKLDSGQAGAFASPVHASFGCGHAQLFQKLFCRTSRRQRQQHRKSANCFATPQPLPVSTTGDFLCPVLSPERDAYSITKCEQNRPELWLFRVKDGLSAFELSGSINTLVAFMPKNCAED